MYLHFGAIRSNKFSGAVVLVTLFLNASAASLFPQFHEPHNVMNKREMTVLGGVGPQWYSEYYGEDAPAGSDYFF